VFRRNGYNLRAVAAAHTGAVLIERHVPYPVSPVLHSSFFFPARVVVRRICAIYFAAANVIHFGAGKDLDRTVGSIAVCYRALGCWPRVFMLILVGNPGNEKSAL
jgi:hypothetical protein